VPYQRKFLQDLLRSNLARKVHLLQILVGPRQVGKTTLIRQLLDTWPDPTHYVTADQIAPPDTSFLERNWKHARTLKGARPILVVDEIQKIPRWSEAVKLLHDEDVREKRRLRVVLLGSSALMLQRGMGESLAGRFQLIPCPHWGYVECRKAFRWSLDKFLFWGGYPGSVPFTRDFKDWREYVLHSLLETVIGRDIPLLYRVDNPALFRQALSLACLHPAEIFSLQKMLGQLQEKGSINTLAHYLEILAGAYLIKPVPKWSPKPFRSKASSPKLVVLNNALVNAMRNVPRGEAMADRAFRGRLTENAVGAALVASGEEVYYWNDRDLEVDFVVRRGTRIIAIEVKSGEGGRRSGLSVFASRHPGTRVLQIGGNGDMTVEAFLENGLPTQGVGWGADHFGRARNPSG